MEKLDVYSLAIKHTLEEAHGDYLEIICNQRELAIKCIENMYKIRCFLDSHPKFFKIIEREKSQEVETPYKSWVELKKPNSSLYQLFRKKNSLKNLFKPQL